MQTKFSISFACASVIGNVRKNNEDNFFCNGRYLPSINTGTESVICGEEQLCMPLVFGVFDGMGGESNGEIAAFLSVESLSNAVKTQKNTLIPAREFILLACKKMNRAVCSYSIEKGKVNMGTTMAIVYFADKEVHIANLGDSRIYRLSENELSQISRDHTAEIPGKIKSPLTQYLGIFEDEMIIEPYIAKGDIKNGDCYLCCSDGLTDMVHENEMEKILKEKMSLKAKVEKLINTALYNGGVDNITVAVCQVNSLMKNTDQLFRFFSNLRNPSKNEVFGRHL